jgi:protein-S-isoprenylcysteine O-methyltransferase Ste14
MATRVATTAYALFAYLTFLVSVVWAIGFLADALVARTVDTGPSSFWPAAVAIDLALLSCFAVQHSVMARAFCKRWLRTLVPASVMRSTYVLVASGILIAVFWFWRPITASVWDVHAWVGRVLILTVYAAGWALVVASTFMIDHFEFLGLRQA